MDSKQGKKLRNPNADKFSYSGAEAQRRKDLITNIVDKYIRENFSEYERFKSQLKARSEFVRTRWGELDPNSVDYLERMALSLPEKLVVLLDEIDPRIFTDISSPKEDEWFTKTFPEFTFGHYSAQKGFLAPK